MSQHVVSDESFLYQHFRSTGHSWSSSKVLVQPVEKIIHKTISTERLKNISRHELELKWIKRLETPFPLGFNDNIYHQGNISKMPNFDAFSLLDFKKRNKLDKRKNGNFKRKHKTVLSLLDLYILLNSGRHQMLSKLASLSVSSLRK